MLKLISILNVEKFKKFIKLAYQFIMSNYTFTLNINIIISSHIFYLSEARFHNLYKRRASEKYVEQRVIYRSTGKKGNIYPSLNNLMYTI